MIQSRHHMDEDLILVAAIGVDAKGDKHPLGLIEGATENAATVQALIDNLIARARSGGAAPLHHRRREGSIQGDPPNLRTRRGDPALSGHKARNIMERLPNRCSLVRRALRQAWELDDADKAEKLIRNLARRLSGLAGVPARSWKASKKSSPSHGWDCRKNCGARSPAPYYREYDGHGAARLPEREAMASAHGLRWTAAPADEDREATDRNKKKKKKMIRFWLRLGQLACRGGYHRLQRAASPDRPGPARQDR